MLHSKLGNNGQTTIPGKVRAALNIKPGDRLVYTVENDRVTIRVHAGIMALKGALASDMGKGLSFTQIRRSLAERGRRC